MSASTTQETVHNRRHQEAATASNGQDTTSQETATFEIAGQDVTLPVTFHAGHVLSANEAAVLYAAYVRQFTNNENAIAKARAEKLAKAATEDARAEAMPWTAAQYVDKFSTYAPNVGGARMGSMEKIRNDAAWRMWTALVAEHNASVTRGGPAVIARAGNKQVPGLKPIRGADGKVVAGGTVAEQRDRMVAKLLTLPEFADRIALQVDAIVAERKGGVDTAADDTVSVDSLFD